MKDSRYRPPKFSVNNIEDFVMICGYEEAVGLDYDVSKIPQAERKEKLDCGLEKLTRTFFLQTDKETKSAIADVLIQYYVKQNDTEKQIKWANEGWQVGRSECLGYLTAAYADLPATPYNRSEYFKWRFLQLLVESEFAPDEFFRIAQSQIDEEKNDFYKPLMQEGLEKAVFLFNKSETIRNLKNE